MISNHRVGIIGSGAAGLITAKTLQNNGISYSIFEEKSQVGGVWKYNKPKTNGSPMYKSLRTNLPKEIMAFNEDFPFNENLNSYLTHEEVQNYLENFYQENIVDSIYFNHKVTKLFKNIQTNQWEITVQNVNINVVRIECFDTVVVCNGHFKVPFIPKIDGMSYFKGESIHAVDYDDNIRFTNLKVLIIGTKSSGTDLAREISMTAMHVYVSGRSISETSCPNDGNITLKPSILRIQENGSILFSDATIVEVDMILWCTGYEYNYPFLDPTSDDIDTTTYCLPKIVIIENKAVYLLYKQLFYANDPSLCFIGLPFSVIPFPLFYIQASWIASIILQKSRLPSLNELITISKEEFETKINEYGIYYYHYYGNKLQFDYMKYVSKEANILTQRFSSYLKMIEEIYNDNLDNRPKYCGASDTYRNRNYHINK